MILTVKYGYLACCASKVSAVTVCALHLHHPLPPPLGAKRSDHIPASLSAASAGSATWSSARLRGCRATPHTASGSGPGTSVEWASEWCALAGGGGAVWGHRCSQLEVFWHIAFLVVLTGWGGFANHWFWGWGIGVVKGGFWNPCRWLSTSHPPCLSPRPCCRWCEALVAKTKQDPQEGGGHGPGYTWTQTASEVTISFKVCVVCQGR